MWDPRPLDVRCICDVAKPSCNQIECRLEYHAVWDDPATMLRRITAATDTMPSGLPCCMGYHAATSQRNSMPCAITWREGYDAVWNGHVAVRYHAAEWDAIPSGLPCRGGIPCGRFAHLVPSTGRPESVDVRAAHTRTASTWSEAVR